jgi:hypothetical protein
VRVKLETAGFFSVARTYRGGHVWEESKRAAPSDADRTTRSE